MKNIVLSTVFLFSIELCNAQIVLEHAISNSNGNVDLIKIDANEYRYIRINSAANSFTIYDLNLSIQNSGIFPFNLTGQSNVGTPQYFTSTLFDCDSTNIEYIVNTKSCTFSCYDYKVLVYRLDGTILFQLDSFKTETINGNVNVRDNYIRNTNQGTKLIVNKETYDSTYIYNLCGILPQPMSINSTEESFKSKLYPNPASDFITYEFNKFVFETGQIKIYNLNGQLMNEYKVDNIFGKIYLETNQYSSGNYIIDFINENGSKLDSKQFSVVK